MKTNLRSRLLPVLGLFLLLLSAATAPADDRGGFAQPGDVVGYWTMIPMSAELTAKNVENPWPLPHQYFAIYANGEMFAHMSTHATDHTPASLDKLHAMLPKTVHYAFNAEGFMVVTRADQPEAKELWGVNLLAQDFTSGGTDFKAGDLLMSLDDGQGTPVYRRLLRRIPAAD
jgi:hypothetical protein